jgi:hypothetical protein
MIVEILNDDGLCHYKMQCEHGISECHYERDHEGSHENVELCKSMMLEDVAAKTCMHGVPIAEHCEECGKTFKHNADSGVLQKKLEDRS